MKTVLYNIYNVAKREIGKYMRYNIYMLCMVTLPILVTVFFTTMMDEGQPENLPVGVVDLDNTTTTRKLTRLLDSFQSSHVAAHYPSIEAARNAVQHGEIYAFIYFPRQMTDDLLSGRHPHVSFYYSNTWYTAGSLLYKDMKTVCLLANASVAQATMSAKGISERQAMALLQPIAVDSHTIGNPWINYNYYLSSMLVPACLLLFVFLFTAFNIGSEFKFNANKELMEIAGGNTFVAIVGKLLPQTVVFTGTFWAALTYMHGLQGFPSSGGLGAIYLLSFLAIIACEGLSLLIYIAFPVLRIAMSISSLWAVLSFSMVGNAFPVIAMDKPLEILSWLFPLRHYYLIFQTSIFNPFPLSYAQENIIALLIMALIPWVFYKRLSNILHNFTYVE